MARLGRTESRIVARAALLDELAPCPEPAPGGDVEGRGDVTSDRRAPASQQGIRPRSRFEEADRLFATCHALDPENFPLPVRFGPDDFKTLLDKVLASLPPVIREAVLEVPVLVEPKPTREVAENAPVINPEILGLFVGVSVGHKLGGSGYGNVVLLFQRNLERAGRIRQEVSKEMKITLLHEYGHYLGFDEEELEHLGLG